jgi:hypothetical protein
MAVDSGGRVWIVFASGAMKIKNAGNPLTGRIKHRREGFPSGHVGSTAAEF